MKLKILDFVRRWQEGVARRTGVPAGMVRPIVTAGFCALVVLLWLLDHAAHVRQAVELAEVRKQAGANISSLKAQADSARREADRQHAQVIRGLQARQAELARAGEELRERLAALQQEERKQVEQAATLPTYEVATRVAARLGLPAQAGLSAPRQAGAGNPKGEASPPRRDPTSRHGDQASPGTSPELRLDETAQRKVLTDLARLDACEEQSTVFNRQVENCNAQVATQAELIHQQSASIESLHVALADQDRMVALLKKEQQAELKAVRGTRWHRLVRTLEHVAIGVVIGAVLR